MNILEVIQKHDDISQREISSQVGISLGMVNMLIKKFIKVGVVKAERLNGNKVKYILTPTGFSYLSKKTADYISRSYKAVLKIQDHMKIQIKKYYTKGETVYIYGPEDEIYVLLIDLLKEMKMSFEHIAEPPDNIKFITWADITEFSEMDSKRFERAIFILNNQQFKE